MLSLAPAVTLAVLLGPPGSGPAEVEDSGDDPGDDPVVRWAAPEGCPVGKAVVDSVARYVGRSLEDETVRAEGRVTVEADGMTFRLELRLSGAEGQVETRTLEDPDCAVLSDVAALMIAVAIDPQAAARVLEDGGEQEIREVTPVPEPAPSEPEPSGPPIPPPEEPAVSPDPVVTPLPAVDDERDLRSCRPGAATRRDVSSGLVPPACVALDARVVLQWGPLPSLGPGIGGDAALLWPRLRLAIGGNFFFARPARIDAAGNLGGDVRLGVGHARGCGRLGWGTLEVPLCGGLELGALRGEGVGIDTPRDDRLLWAAAAGHAGLAWSPVRRFAARVQVGAVVPLVRQRFAIGGLGLVHQPAPVGVRASIAVELRLP